MIPAKKYAVISHYAIPAFTAYVRTYIAFENNPPVNILIPPD